MGPLRAEELSRSVRGRTRLPERREGGGGGGRPLSRATAPEPEGSMSDTSPDLLVDMCVSMTHFLIHTFSESVGSNDGTQLRKKVITKTSLEH